MTATVHYHDHTVTFDDAIAESLGLKGDGELQVEVTSAGVLLKPKKAKPMIPPHPLPLEVRREMLRKSAGIWKDRTDLPDFDKLRAEADRF
jgi:hypothetical protein